MAPHDLGLLLSNVPAQKLNVFLDIFLLRICHGRRSLLCVLRLRGLLGEGNGTKGQEYEKRATYGHSFLH
jgi:hypothetical protein